MLKGIILLSEISNVIMMNLSGLCEMETFSYLDTGRDPSREEPERFYHGI